MPECPSESHATAIPALGTRFIWTFILVIGWAGAAFAADGGTVSSLVVKFRDDWGAPASASALPDDARRALTAALRGDFSETGRTRDGAFTIAFATPLPFVEARAVVNRVRGITPVLYANIIAPNQAGGRRDAAAVDATGIGTNQFIVKYRDPALISAARAGLPPDQARIDRLTTVLGETVRYGRAMSGGSYVFRLSRRMLPAEAEAAAAKIALEPDIEYAEPDRIMQHTLTPNDSLYAANQWDLFEAIGGINAPAGWDTTTGTAGGIAADIDTGLLDHPDLAGRFVSSGYDFIYDNIVANDGDPAGLPLGCSANPVGAGCSSRDADAHDPGDWVTSAESSSGWLIGCPIGNSTWHGTHTAGTIAAASNNAAGIAGINWVGKILPLRVLGKCGGYSSDIEDAIVWASGGTVPGVPANGTPARVMNLSLGGGGACDASWQTAINTALANNAVVVVVGGQQQRECRRPGPRELQWRDHRRGDTTRRRARVVQQLWVRGGDRGAGRRRREVHSFDAQQRRDDAGSVCLRVLPRDQHGGAPRYGRRLADGRAQPLADACAGVRDHPIDGAGVPDGNRARLHEQPRGRGRHDAVLRRGHLEHGGGARDDVIAPAGT